jgi:hypothetical protein
VQVDQVTEDQQLSGDRAKTLIRDIRVTAGAIGRWAERHPSMGAWLANRAAVVPTIICIRVEWKRQLRQASVTIRAISWPTRIAIPSSTNFGDTSNR